MVTKETFRKLLYLVNSEAYFDPLKLYVEERIGYHLKQLEHATSFEVVLEHQGALRELRRFATLKEEAVKGAK